jgi:hypothetical protein
MVTAEQKRAARREPENSKTVDVVPAAFKTGEALIYLGGISAITLYRWVERGLLRPHRHMRGLLFSRVELDRFLSQTRNKRWQRRKAAMAPP